MQLIRIVNDKTIAALNKISKSDLAPQTLYRVRKLLNRLGKDVEFYNERKAAVWEKYGHKQDGKYILNDGVAEEFTAKMEELLKIEVEDVEPVMLPLTEQGVRLSCDDLMALDGLIVLEEPEVGKNG